MHISKYKKSRWHSIPFYYMQMILPISAIIWSRGVPYFDHCSYTPGNEIKVGIKPFSRKIVVLNNVNKCKILMRPPYY